MLLGYSLTMRLACVSVMGWFDAASIVKLVVVRCCYSCSLVSMSSALVRLLSISSLGVWVMVWVLVAR